MTVVVHTYFSEGFAEFKISSRAVPIASPYTSDHRIVATNPDLYLSCAVDEFLEPAELLLAIDCLKQASPLLAVLHDTLCFPLSSGEECAHPCGWFWFRLFSRC